MAVIVITKSLRPPQKGQSISDSLLTAHNYRNLYFNLKTMGRICSQAILDVLSQLFATFNTHTFYKCSAELPGSFFLKQLRLVLTIYLWQFVV